MKKESKKKLYLVLWIIMGILFGILVSGIIELTYIKLGYTTSYLFLATYAAMIIAGIFLGLWTGPKAWQKIYVEGVRGKKYIKG